MSPIKESRILRHDIRLLSMADVRFQAADGELSVCSLYYVSTLFEATGPSIPRQPGALTMSDLRLQFHEQRRTLDCRSRQ